MEVKTLTTLAFLLKYHIRTLPCYEPDWRSDAAFLERLYALPFFCRLVVLIKRADKGIASLSRKIRFLRWPDTQLYAYPNTLSRLSQSINLRL